MAVNVRGNMEYESTKLIIEGIAIVVVYIITMIVLIVVKK